VAFQTVGPFLFPQLFGCWLCLPFKLGFCCKPGIAVAASFFQMSFSSPFLQFRSLPFTVIPGFPNFMCPLLPCFCSERTSKHRSWPCAVFPLRFPCVQPFDFNGFLPLFFFFLFYEMVFLRDLGVYTSSPNFSPGEGKAEVPRCYSHRYLASDTFSPFFF